MKRAEDSRNEPSSSPTATDWRRIVKSRMLVAAVAFGVWGAFIEVRLLDLQVFRRTDLLARAERQQNRTIPAEAKRGEIVDRHGRVLAYSVDADSVFAVPSEIDNADRTAAALCEVLSECTERERESFGERLRRQSPFVFIRRLISPEECRRLEGLNLRGIKFLKESRRFYPNRELAAHLLGWVGIENKGMGGIEWSYDKQIRGRAGAVLIQTDARQQAFSRVGRPPTAGATLELTIDEYLQHIAERELHAGIVAARAEAGTALIMDPRTGEILAVANEPTFNPNNIRSSTEDARRNRAVQDLYEPGSTFKIVTASAAIEEHVWSPQDIVDAGHGFIRFGARQIDEYNMHAYGAISFTDVFVKSSNVGAIRVGLKVGAERIGRYVHRFGFGRRISSDFPSENGGIVWDPARWNESTLASVSMGYEIGVTPLQMAAAVSSVANGGNLIEPRLVRAVIHGNERAEIAPRVLRRTITAATAAELTTIMEKVVVDGTAKRAAVPGYMVAGKTGTAQKLINGNYSHTNYNASFVGFVPSRNPALTIIVVIDSPRAGGYTGGLIAAPIFKRIAQASLQHLGLPPSINPSAPLTVFRHSAQSDGAASLRVTANDQTPPLEVFAGAPGMPDVRGLSAREAVRTLARLGIVARLRGTGIVTEQEPSAGAPLDGIASSLLVLNRLAPQAQSVALAVEQP